MPFYFVPDVIYDLLQKGHLQVSTHHGVSYDDAVTALDVNNVHLDLLQSVQFSSMSGVSTESAMSLSTSSRILKYLVFDEIDHIMNKSAGKETASLTKLLGMPAEQAVFVSASLSKDQAIHYSRLSKRSDMPLDPPHNFESLSSMLPAMEMSFDLGAAKQSVLFLSQIDLEMRLAAAADTTGTSTSSPPRMPIGTRHYFLKVPSGINKYDVLLDVLCQFKLKAKVAKAKDAAQRVGRHQIKSIDSVPLYSLSAKRNPLNICPGAVLAFFSRAFPISHFGLPHILRNGGLSAWALTDSASRQDRKNALGSDKLVDVIFSTDVLARGLDLPNLSLVVNADVPISTTT